MHVQKKRDYIREGQTSYAEWREGLLSDPTSQIIYRQEKAKKELWLQLVEARYSAGISQVELAKRMGVSQAQVARIEKRGYDDYTLNTLRRYINALGEGFSLEVAVHH